eukprot:SM000044S16008  [mRNA]  locus=s44:520457:520879:+ [translate_table: standard]
MPAKKRELKAPATKRVVRAAGTAREHCLGRQIALSESDMGTVPCYIPVVYGPRGSRCWAWRGRQLRSSQLQLMIAWLS